LRPWTGRDAEHCFCSPRIIGELQAAKALRAAESERQLQEVMVSFWFNHFNVYARKNDLRWSTGPYERDVIRAHALGTFPDLLRATARHPAMLFYLDNWRSTRVDFTILFGPDRGRKAGLNENYARELMELHTLGVDGGYTQKDVTEVSRAFTGWTIDRPQIDGRFVFRAQTHDGGRSPRSRSHTRVDQVADDVQPFAVPGIGDPAVRQVGEGHAGVRIAPAVGRADAAVTEGTRRGQ
jgi:hypothetical protein